MSKDIRNGRWLQLRGRAKRFWARWTRDERMAAEAEVEIVTGALTETYGVVMQGAARGVVVNADAFAAFARRTARQLTR